MGTQSRRQSVNGLETRMWFLPWCWEGYNESIILHVLGLASPTYSPCRRKPTGPLPRLMFGREIYGREQLYAGPLFNHQTLALMDRLSRHSETTSCALRESTISRIVAGLRHTQQQYAITNPREFRGYSKNIWGITASRWARAGRAQRRRDQPNVFDYEARGIPDGPDDGTIAPWAAVASLPFAPEIVLPTLRYFNEAYPEMRRVCMDSSAASIRHSLPEDPRGKGWIS